MQLNWSQESYIQAYKFAAQAHLGQTVPGSDIPYIMHLSFVCMEVITALTMEPQHDGNLAVQCALLHDTIEDTDTTYAEIKQEFGAAVADGVMALTKDDSLEKHLQMSDSLHRIKKRSPEIWMVKMADRITNLQPPPHYWQQEKINRYAEEARQIYTELQAASPFLALRLQQKISDYQAFTV
jgi:guanosine-3',5'-bis(diphosphate) 3'-pyrophosphohydrolase